MEDEIEVDVVAQFVKDARKTMGLTLEAFGDVFGRTKANVHGWEKGLHEPAYTMLLAISHKSGVPLPGLAPSESDQFAPRPSAVASELAAAFDALVAAPDVKRQLYARLLGEIQAAGLVQQSRPDAGERGEAPKPAPAPTRKRQSGKTLART